jgi:hypothetical protein
MVPTSLSKDDWALLVPRISDGECVAFLGAGANVAPSGATGLPLGAQVAAQLAEALTGVNVREFDDLVNVFDDLVAVEPYKALRDYRELLRLGLYDLPRVASYVELRRDPAFLMKQLRAILDDTAYKPSPVLRTLARLPFRLIVTTNYDNLMERALDHVGVEYLRVVQPVGGFDEKRRRDLNDELAGWGDRLVLYKIHGSLLPPGGNLGGGTGDLLVTEEDYIRYLTIANVQDRGVPNIIAGMLKASTILFLGYSLEDWDFRTIFKSLIEPLERHTQFQSFAFQRKPPVHWEKFWVQKHVDIIDQDVSKFAQKLEAKCAKFIRPEPDWGQCP